MVVADGLVPIWRQATATIVMGPVDVRSAQRDDISQSAQWCPDSSTLLLSRQIDVLW